MFPKDCGGGGGGVGGSCGGCCGVRIYDYDMDSR